MEVVHFQKELIYLFTIKCNFLFGELSNASSAAVRPPGVGLPTRSWTLFLKKKKVNTLYHRSMANKSSDQRVCVGYYLELDSIPPGLANDLSPHKYWWWKVQNCRIVNENWILFFFRWFISPERILPQGCLLFACRCDRWLLFSRFFVPLIYF
jgi:hypothetical protein